MIRCSFTNDRPSGGIASIYWAWFTIDHERTARKVHYCLPCYEALAATPIRRAATVAAEDRYESCLGCGVSIDGEGALFYGTLYAPKSDPFQFELWYCWTCFDKERHELAQMGTPLPDRETRSVAPAASPWANFLNSPEAVA